MTEQQVIGVLDELDAGPAVWRFGNVELSRPGCQLVRFNRRTCMDDRSPIDDGWQGSWLEFDIEIVGGSDAIFDLHRALVRLTNEYCTARFEGDTYPEVRINELRNHSQQYRCSAIELRLSTRPWGC